MHRRCSLRFTLLTKIDLLPPSPSDPKSLLTVTYFSPLASVSLAPSSPIAVATLPPFAQPPRNTTTLAFRLEVDGAYVGPDDAAPLKGGGVGTMEVQVRLAAVAVFDRGGWRTRRRVMRVMCDGVPVAFRGKNGMEAAFTGPARRFIIAAADIEATALLVT
uniref:Late embryogenesis abundant protein LEA-2 subgroup domain-containing protein n=2 Tax=Oryza TaxID=4527 RepID=A0A0E0I4E5_ORYNI